VARQVRDEIRAAGPLDGHASIERLPLLHACLLETGRLFPPVTRTFHTRAASGGGDRRLVLHWFPLLQRDDGLGPTVHAFNPERWTAPSPDAAAAASNLFLRGPRQCPGMDLILFVCKAALVRLIADFGVGAAHPRLTSDPLPVSFPTMVSRFTSTEGLS
jgi:cytochrome P450